MLKNPQDRRARRTALQIKETMLSCMERKAIHEIRVSEICSGCQINRATFYDHYRDVFDLVQDLQTDLLLKLESLMNMVSPENTPDEVVSRLFFDFLTENRRSMTILLSCEQSQIFIKRLDKRIMPFFEQKIRQNYEIPAGMERQLCGIMEFAAAGYYRFFMKALTAPPKEVIAEAELCARLSDACLRTQFRRRSNLF